MVAALMRLPVCLGVVLPVCLAGGYAHGAEGETFGRTGYGKPINVFSGSAPIDHLYDFLLYLTGGVCLAVFVVLIVFLIKYRHQPGRRATFIHGNNKLEAVWTLIPTVIMALIAAFSQNTWSALKNPQNMANLEDPVEVEVIGKQFAWYFHYPGKDGQFGPRTPEQINLLASNPDQIIGLDRAHPAAKDDLVTTVMYAPVNRNIRVRLSSVDVLHSFFLPNFRVKQDTVPGLDGYVWFRANQTSEQVMGRFANGQPKPFDIVCAELCGQGHFKMRGQLFVISEDQYQKWLDAEAEYLGEDEDEGY